VLVPLTLCFAIDDTEPAGLVRRLLDAVSPGRPCTDWPVDNLSG
jgi:hypothetical protein